MTKMSDHRKLLIGFLKVVLLSIVLEIPLSLMVEYQWPAWCFEGSRGFGFFVPLISCGIVLWIAAYRWVDDCHPVPSFMMAGLLGNAFVFGLALRGATSEYFAAICIVSAMGIFMGMFLSWAAWITLSPIERIHRNFGRMIAILFLMSILLFIAAVTASEFYALAILLIGLRYLRILEKEKTTSMPSAVVHSLE